MVIYKVGKRNICKFRCLLDNERTPYEQGINECLVWVRVQNETSIRWHCIRNRYTNGKPILNKIIDQSTSAFNAYWDGYKIYMESEFIKELRKAKLNKISKIKI